MDKVDSQTLLDEIKANARKQFRMDSTIVKIMGAFYWKQHSGKDFDALAENAFTILKDSGIHSDEDATKFLMKEAPSKPPRNQLQYHFWVVEDFKDNESMLMCKMHHGVGDGISMVIAAMKL